MKKQVVAAALAIIIILIVVIAVGFGKGNKINGSERGLSSDDHYTVSASAGEKQNLSNGNKNGISDISGENTDGADSGIKEISASGISETTGGKNLDSEETEIDILSDESSETVNSNSKSGSDSSDNGKPSRADSKADSVKPDKPVGSLPDNSGNSENASSRDESESGVSSSDGGSSNSGTIELPIIPMD